VAGAARRETDAGGAEMVGRAAVDNGSGGYHLARARWRLASLAVLWAALVLMLWPMQRAWFTVVDDHHVVALAGADGRVSAREAAAGLRAQAFERNGRVRPLFWVLWHLEALRAGTDPARWHRDRLVLALLAAAALYAAAETALPPPLAALAAFASFCGFQNEIWMRLRVQETYGMPLAALGAALLARPLAGGWTTPSRLWPGWLALGLAGLVKESFVPLLPAALIFVYKVYPRPGFPVRGAAGSRRDRVLLGAAVVLAAAMGVALLEARWRFGPLYGAPLTAASLATNAWRHVWLVTKDSGWPLPVLAAGLALVLARAPRSEWRHPAVLLAAGAALLLAPQWLVYGSGSVEARYLAPGCFFATWACAVGLRALWDQARPGGVVAARLLLAAAVVGLVALDAKWVRRDRAVARSRAEHTQAYRAALDAVADALRRRPELDLVFRTEDPFDFEPVDSAWRFLAWRLGPELQPYLLASDRRRSRDGTEIGDRLAAQMSDRAAGAEHAFRSQAAFPGDPDRCLEVTLRADPAGAVCRRRVAFPAPEAPAPEPAWW
jgi:hypothetical protein